jgi:hypothetical protein
MYTKAVHLFLYDSTRNPLGSVSLHSTKHTEQTIDLHNTLGFPPLRLTGFFVSEDQVALNRVFLQSLGSLELTDGFVAFFLAHWRSRF